MFHLHNTCKIIASQRTTFNMLSTFLCLLGAESEYYLHSKRSGSCGRGRLSCAQLLSYQKFHSQRHARSSTTFLLQTECGPTDEV